MAERDDWTLVHLVRQQAAALGDKVFLTSEQGVSLTYAGLDRRSDDLAAALVRLGVEPGDRVLALMRNSAECVGAVFAIAKAGEASGTAIKDSVRKIAQGAGQPVDDVVDGLKLLAAGKDINFEGASGACDFTEIGDILTTNFRYEQVEKGKFKLLKIA